jgi:inorganic pyrophosphatase
MAALGMLSTLTIGLTIDGYGPISDNAGGNAEICKLGEHVRERTDALDAAGHTTAANGKGFAIGSAALVSLALFSAYTVRAEILPAKLSLLEPMVVSGLLVGAMLSYVFSGMTMKSVVLAAMTMVPTPHPEPPLLRAQFFFAGYGGGRYPGYQQGAGRALALWQTRAGVRFSIWRVCAPYDHG